MATRNLRFFTPAADAKNAADLDRRSRLGQQLKKPGSLLYQFESGATAQRHLLDYCPLVLGEKELQGRQAVIEAAGWSLIGVTHAGWHFYRKEENESAEQSAYEHPCPRAAQERRYISQIGILSALRALILLAGAAGAVYAMVSREQMVLPAVLFLLLVLMVSFKIQGLQRKLKP